MWKCEEDASLLVSVSDSAFVLWFHHSAVHLCTVVWDKEGLSWLKSCLAVVQGDAVSAL